MHGSFLVCKEQLFCYINVRTSADKKKIGMLVKQCLTEECYLDGNIQWFLKHFEYSSCFNTRPQTCCHTQYVLMAHEHYKVSADSSKEYCWTQLSLVWVWDNQVSNSRVQLNGEFWTLPVVSVSPFLYSMRRWKGSEHLIKML